MPSGVSAHHPPLSDPLPPPLLLLSIFHSGRCPPAPPSDLGYAPSLVLTFSSHIQEEDESGRVGMGASNVKT